MKRCWDMAWSRASVTGASDGGRGPSGFPANSTCFFPQHASPVPQVDTTQRHHPHSQVRKLAEQLASLQRRRHREDDAAQGAAAGTGPGPGRPPLPAAAGLGGGGGDGGDALPGRPQPSIRAAAEEQARCGPLRDTGIGATNCGWACTAGVNPLLPACRVLSDTKRQSRVKASRPALFLQFPCSVPHMQGCQ